MIEKKNLIDQVSDYILTQIKEGEIKPGDRLESQDDMAAKLGVSRSTLREAFSRLTSIGVLEIKHGQGTFVKQAQDYTYLTNVIDTYLTLEKDSILHILEVRKIIEQYTIQLATKKAVAKDIDALEALVTKLETLKHGSKPYIKKEMELQFHLEIARISNNPVLYKLLSIVITSLNEEFSGSVEMPFNHGKPAVTHSDILKSIKERNVEKAAENMNRHLESIMERVKHNLETYERKQPIY